MPQSQCFRIHTYVIDNVCVECNSCFIGTRGGVELPDTARDTAEWCISATRLRH